MIDNAVQLVKGIVLAVALIVGAVFAGWVVSLIAATGHGWQVLVYCIVIGFVAAIAVTYMRAKAS